jgi:alpha/beta superfamily hydrolase
MLKTKTHFENTRGDRLCGILSNPSGDIEEPIIIMCHGFSTSKDGRTNTLLEELLNKHGISTFRFDFFGHGESEGLFEEVTISEAVDDVQKALNYLQHLGYTLFGLIGSSFGGIVSILAASKSDEFDVLALKSPVSDYLGLLIAQGQNTKIDKWKEEGSIPITGADGQSLRLNYSFYEDAEQIRGYEAVKNIQIPTLIVHGDKDETVPLEQSKISASLMSHCRLEIIQGADHIYSQPRHFEKMIDLLSQFIINHFT